MALNTDPDAWARLGRAVRIAREAKGPTQEQLGARAGVSGRVVQSIEAGNVPRRRMPYTLTPIARELGWPAGSVDAVLGGEPAPGGWVDRPVALDEEMVEQVRALLHHKRGWRGDRNGPRCRVRGCEKPRRHSLR